MEQQFEYDIQPQQTPKKPMKWHNFLIYFSLWAGAVLSVVSSITYFTGAHYQGSASLVYSFYSGLRLIDLLMGLACVGLAVFGILTRFALAGYKAKGPRMLMICYAANAAASVLYLLLVSAVTGMALSEVLDSSTIGSLVGSIAMIFINNNYYSKRAELFVK